VFIFILVFSALMGWSFISHVKSRQILSGVEASSGGDIQSMGFPPAPILSCFDAAVDIPDLQEEARVRGDNTNQGGRRVKEILDKLNRPWAEIQGSLDKSLSHRLDEAIKEKALQIKISALADIALYGLQKWKKNEISLENSSFCTQAWQSKFSNYFEANKNAVNYALKSLNNGAIAKGFSASEILNKARIFHVLKILIKNRSDLETLAKMKRESSQKKAQDFGQSVAEAVALGQSAQNPKVAELAFDIELLQKKRRQDIESLGEEYLKLEKRLAEENIVFEAPELFKPKGYIDLTPGVVDWDRSIGIMEPSRLFKDLEGMLQSHGLFQAILSVPQDERDSRINEFIDKNYKDLRRAFYFSYSELFNQGLREYEDLCRRDPKEFYANKLLVGMAATHLMTSDAKVSRDDIIKSYRPVCENLARQERLQKTTEGALESLSVAGSALGVVSLAFPLAAGTLKILPNLAARGATLGDGTVAYVGTNTSFSESALAASAVYFYDIFAYNGAGPTINYLAVGQLEGSQSTLANPATTQATNLVLPNGTITNNQVVLNWTNGNGAKRIVLMQAGSAVNANPSNGTGYTANAVFGSGTQIGTGNYVVYDGTGSSVTVTGLTPSTSYGFQVFEYNGTGSDNNYNISAAAGNPTSVLTRPDAPVANVPAAVDGVSFLASWSAVTGSTGYFIDVSTDNFSTFVSTYNNFAVAGNSLSVIGLSSGVTYQYRVRAANATGSSTNSNTINQLTFPAAPVAAAATVPGQTSFTANWGAVTSATDYYIDVATDAGFANLLANYTNRKVTGSTSLAITGLTAGTLYYYQIHIISAKSTPSSPPWRSTPITRT
jgi:hypothetical protein